MIFTLSNKQIIFFLSYDGTLISGDIDTANASQIRVNFRLKNDDIEEDEFLLKFR